MFYSNTIFKDIGFSANKITALIGIVNFITSGVGIVLLGMFGRKTLMLTCSCLMVVLLGLVGLSIDQHWNTVTVACIMSFITLFEFSSGPITWLYMSEIMQDKALSIATVLNWCMNLVISIITPTIATPETIPYIFYSVSALTLFGSIFIAIFMKETKGLSQNQLEVLFVKHGAKIAEKNLLSDYREKE